MINMAYCFSLSFNTLALILFFIFAYRKNTKVFRTGTVSLVLGTVILIGFLAFQAISSPDKVLGTVFFSYNAFAVLIYILYFVFEFRFKIKLLGTFIVPIGYFLNVLAGIIRNTTPADMKPLSAFILGVHSGLLMLGEALFILAFACAVMYLIQEKNLKSKRFNQWYDRLPALGKLEEMAEFAIMSGFPLITAGFLIGCFWAAAIWGGQWYFDPKIIFSVVSWVIYSLLFYGKITDRLEGKRFINLVVLSFILVVISLITSSSFTALHSAEKGFGVK